jgi:chromosome segregation ATPase
MLEDKYRTTKAAFDIKDAEIASLNLELKKLRKHADALEMKNLGYQNHIDDLNEKVQQVKNDF